ncbi:hypothetical protein F5J12DRAFT_843749 [Pisolithus orientalis]|uniref:uncharacterized protein n=1 Tax=Pisolithus orientalis TaxID=936130 RepID=UPI0022243268|nr:uncharacterized protein F5J12DRAFT_843749 [Pisolithus orientalis]KAI6001667.1 hypothetical protein F5J12DRAFT_843749 [Pisolithus orientalis]
MSRILHKPIVPLVIVTYLWEIRCSQGTVMDLSSSSLCSYRKMKRKTAPNKRLAVLLHMTRLFFGVMVLTPSI